MESTQCVSVVGPLYFFKQIPNVENICSFLLEACGFCVSELFLYASHFSLSENKTEASSLGFGFVLALLFSYFEQTQ